MVDKHAFAVRLDFRIIAKEIYALAALGFREGASFFQNCHYCHGDQLNGLGMFSHVFNPTPANFIDPGTIVMLRESFLFWRISKGAPGMPEEGGPWDSAMPAWENFLTEEQIWEVIAFLYEYNGYDPRALHDGVH